MIPIALESSEHHVCGVQRVDEVRREGVLLFHRVRPPEKRQKTRNKEVAWSPQITSVSDIECIYCYAKLS